MRSKFTLLLAFFLVTLLMGPIWAFQPIAMLPNLSSLSLEVISRSSLIKDQNQGLHLFYISKNPLQINYFSSLDHGNNWQEETPLKIIASQEVAILKSQIDVDNQIFLAYKETPNSLVIQTLDPKKFNPSLSQTIKTTSPIDQFEITLHENYLKLWILSNQELTLIKVDKRTLREEKRQILSSALTNFVLCQQDKDIYIFGKADEHKVIKMTYNLLLSKISERQEIFVPSEEIMSLATEIYLGQPVYLVLARNQGTYQIKNLKGNLLLIENREPIFEFSLKSMDQNLIMFVTSNENNNRIANAYTVSNLGNSIKKIYFPSPEPLLSTLMLDQTPPKITLIENLEDKEYENESLRINGSINEEISQMKIKGRNISLIQQKFSTVLSLEAGENLISIEAWDIHGNYASKNLRVFFWPQKPLLTCLSPSSESWFPSGVAIYAEWAVTDFQNDLEEQPATELYIDNKPVEALILFDPEEKKAKAFIPLSESLIEGKYALKLRLKDKAQNIGEISSFFKIDNTPPKISASKIYINPSQKFLLPAIDTQSGLDLKKCQLKIKDGAISYEAQLNFVEQTFCFPSSVLFQEKSYAASIFATDKAGNTTSNQSLEVTVDKTAPVIARHNPENNLQTENPEVLFDGEINEQYLASAQLIINNKGKIPLILQNGVYFSQMVKLTKEDDNIIEIKVEDCAGNSTSQTLNIKSLGLKGATSSTDNFCYGPNPFNPNKEACYFKFNLPAASNIKLLIYSLNGELIKNSETSASGFVNLEWDGKDQTGKIMDNGVYQYYIIAGSLKKKGKIILLK